MVSRDGLDEQDLIIPISAHMLNNRKDYDMALENFSRPLMERIKFSTRADGHVTVHNPKEVEAYFRYPNLTHQSIYLARTI